MNPQTVQQIVESIKTLNLNINDATTQKLADTVIPVVKLYLIKEYVHMGLDWLATIALIVGVCWIVGIIVKANKKNVDRSIS